MVMKWISRVTSEGQVPLLSRVLRWINSCTHQSSHVLLISRLSELRCKETARTVLPLEMQAHWQEKVRNDVLELFGQQNPSPRGISRLKTVSEKLKTTIDSDGNNYLTYLCVQCTQLFFCFFSPLVDEHGYQRIPIVSVLREAKQWTRLGNVIIQQIWRSMLLL